MGLPRLRPPAATRGVLMGVRRLRTDRGVAVTVVLVALLLAGLLAALPRQLTHTSDQALRFLLADAPTAQRGVLTSTSGSLGTARRDDPLALVREAGQDQVRDLPAPLRAIIDSSHAVVSTPRYDALALPGQPPGQPRHLTLRVQEGIEDHARIVDGRWPASPAQAGPGATFLPPDAEDETDTVPVREIAVSEKTAAQLHVGVGDRIFAAVDANDPLVRRGAFDRSSRRSLLVVTGIVALDPLTDPYWFDDGSLFEAREVTRGLNTDLFATALLAPAAYRDLTRGGAALYTEWRHLVPPERVDPSRVQALAEAVQRADASYPDRARIAEAGSVGLRTGLDGILSDFFRQRQLATRVLALVASGVLAVALAVIAMVGLMAARRQRDRVALVRSRGASGVQLAAAEVVEALLLTVPAGALGALAAVLLVPGRRTAAPVVLAGVAAVLAASMVVAAALGPIRAGLRTLLRRDAAVTRPTPRRLVAEAALVAVAVIALVLLRRRGLSDDTGLDPLLVAVPPLLALAVAIVTVRLLPVPMRLAARVAARSRGAVGVLALRRTAREPATVLLPLLVLVLALGIATFASVLTTTVDRGQVTGAWQTVGADVLVSRPPEEPLTGLDTAGVHGVTTTASAAYRLPVASLPDGTTGSVSLLAADRSLTQVTAGTPAALVVPEPPAGEDAPLPALATARGPGDRRLRVGDRLTVSVASHRVPLVITGVTTSIPAVAAELPALVVARSGLAAAIDRDVRADARLPARHRHRPGRAEHAGTGLRRRDHHRAGTAVRAARLATRHRHGHRVPSRHDRRRPARPDRRGGGRRALRPRAGARPVVPQRGRLQSPAAAAADHRRAAARRRGRRGRRDPRRPRHRVVRPAGAAPDAVHGTGARPRRHGRRRRRRRAGRRRPDGRDHRDRRDDPDPPPS